MGVPHKKKEKKVGGLYEKKMFLKKVL